MLDQDRLICFPGATKKLDQEPSGSGPGTVYFDVWGNRGSKGVAPPTSKIGNLTSCYSILDGEHLFVLDAGTGLAALASALRSEPRWTAVRKIHVFVSHAHLDHWEGIKDADWFWTRGNGLDIRLCGPAEALGAIRQRYEHPSFVPLEILSIGTVAGFSYEELPSGASITIGPWHIETFELNHSSGSGPTLRSLETLGYRLSRKDGPAIAYLLDHKPTATTRAVEKRMLKGTHLVVLDTSYSSVAEECHGHGSFEQAADFARSHPKTLVLAGHLGPLESDSAIRAAYRDWSENLSNLEIAVELRSRRWDAAKATFIPVKAVRATAAAKPPAAKRPPRLSIASKKPRKRS